VADPVCPVERLEPDGLFQVAKLAFGAADGDLPVFIYDRNACGIVTAIFQLLQPVEYYPDHLLVAYVTDYSTHTDSSPD
jgi:hypothetical protein